MPGTTSACGTWRSGLATRGCHVVMSNSTAPEIGELYKGNGDVKAGRFEVLQDSSAKGDNSKAARRGVVDEYVITNVSATVAI